MKDEYAEYQRILIKALLFLLSLIGWACLLVLPWILF